MKRPRWLFPVSDEERAMVTITLLATDAIELGMAAKTVWPEDSDEWRLAENIRAIGARKLGGH